MKRLLLTLALVLALALPAGAAIEYVDFAAGDDDTGDGSYSTPWATIGKCTTTKTGGDECRVAKHTPTALSGTLTFTNGSTSVSTSVDLTGDVAAGDYVGLNATDESWWRVASLTSDTITLNYQYWGPGTGVATAGYVAVYTLLSGDIDFNSSGVSMVSRLKITGGWDLTTQTQDGMTFLSNYGLSFNSLETNNQAYWEFSKFVILSSISTSYDHIYGRGYGSLVKDVIWVNSSYEFWYGTQIDPYRHENIIQSGGGDHGLYYYYQVYTELDGFISYSAGNGSGDYGIYITNGSQHNHLKDIKIYNSYDYGVRCYGHGASIYFENLEIYSPRTNGCMYMNDAHDFNFYNFICSDAASGPKIYSDCRNVFFYNPTFTDITGQNIIAVSTTSGKTDTSFLSVSKFDGVAGDDRVYFGGDASQLPTEYIQKDTTDARSGSCLKWYPNEAFYEIPYKVGTFKVTDGNSNLTLSVYMKDNAGFDGTVVLYAVSNGRIVGTRTEKTMTTSYVQQSITVSSDDIATDDYVHLWVAITGTAGNVFVDDFSGSN